ncbi:MAG: phosphate signaling complex PhoU family protein [Candidatus Thorarchaeota archaeon]|jgi:phosphate transport system protein
MSGTRKQLEQYLEDIEESLGILFDNSMDLLMESMTAFKELDHEKASKVKSESAKIEELALKIERDVFDTIARRQPVAKDLRTLATFLQVSHSLYRVGRYAYKIAHIAKMCDKNEHYKELVSLPHMAHLAKQTLLIAKKAVLDEDLSEIDELEKLEAETDKETVEMFQEISEYLRKEDGIERMSMFYMIIGRYFERAADQAFQIAERAIYMVTGEKKQLGIAYQREDSVGPH